ncbi:amino acid ABC transporter substrate-binding protein [Sneathiella chinensis]|nr:amino acid ABC transporter substrate-binding protein [Sneathiella chinensis]
MRFLRMMIMGYMLVWAASGPALAEGEGTLQKVRERGYLLCGVGDHDFGFAERDTNGKWHGFDVDLCRAIATATLGEPDKVRFIPVDSQSRLPALLAGEIDVLFRTTTWTMQRDSTIAIDFTRVMLFEVQGVIARGELGITSLKEVRQGTICVNAGTTSHLNLREYLEVHNPGLDILVLETQEGRWQAFFNGRCDLMSSDLMDLQAGKVMLAPSSEDMTLLTDIISKEPLAPAVRNEDAAWFDIIKWVLNGVIALEENRISSTNIDERLTGLSGEAKRMLGPDVTLGKTLGLDAGWLERIARDVGNYGEIFERNLGQASPFKIERKHNRLWTEGGLIYAMPLR